MNIYTIALGHPTVHTLRFFISLYIPHLQIEFFDHSLWLEWFYKGNKLQSKLFFQSNKTLADVITAYFLTFQRIVYILNAELNITNVLWSDKAWQSFILNPLKKIESKEMQFKLTIYIPMHHHCSSTMQVRDRPRFFDQVGHQTTNASKLHWK